MVYTATHPCGGDEKLLDSFTSFLAVRRCVIPVMNDGHNVAPTRHIDDADMRFLQ